MGRPRIFDGLSERALVVPALVLAFAIVWAWTAVLAGGPMGGSVAVFLVAWVAMMAAMMLPSAAPMVLLYRLSGSGPRGEVRTLVFASGYLLVWGAVGLAAYAVAAASAAVTPGSRSVVAAAVLVLAGVYQFTPLKGACLRACRTPADFLMQHWRGGTGGALRLGFHHGAYCLGCCWALMLVLVVAGSMGLGWVVFVAAVVFAEKLLPRGAAFGRALGIALVIAGILLAARPDLVPFVANDRM